MPLSEDLDRLDTAIRQLQVKWDLFFAGAEKKPPTELQAQVEALVRRWANQEIRNNGERFRYQGLTARYATFNELWQKRLRAREEGKVFGMHGLRAEQLPPPPAPREARPAPAPGRGRRVRVPGRRRAARHRLDPRTLRPVRRGAAAGGRGAGAGVRDASAS